MATESRLYSWAANYTKLMFTYYHNHSGLSREQINVLWSCLALDVNTCDFLLSWLYNQVRSQESHSLSLDSLRYIYKSKVGVSLLLT